MSRRMIILTDGHNNPHVAKTAVCVLRYRPEEVVAVLDREAAGKTCADVFGVGGSIPVIGSLADAPTANALLIGIAPPGGKIPDPWREIILQSIARKLDVVSGLHDFLNDDPEFSQAAARHGVRLVDLRDNQERDVSHRRGIWQGCLRIHTVANDCSSGKMVTAVEVADGLCRRGIDARFVATGQTGMMVAGDGCCVDRVISDFVAGAAEKLVLANQHHQAILVEGQGSLFHPRYSGVTLSLLHGCMPDGLIVCYEMGREVIYGMEDVRLPSLEKLIQFYEDAANLVHPCRVIGIAVNGQKYPDAEVEAECQAVSRRHGLPACDVIRQGPQTLVEAVIEFGRTLGKLDY